MSTKIALDSPLANVTSEIEERQCNLLGRHRELKNKVATMERSIPALMAYNMLMAEQDCRDTPYDKIREIMNKFSPQPDPADRLFAELRSTVDNLHQETAQLHDKIIDADVKLEETGMELESLELANKEMEEKLTGLRNEIRRRRTPSLHSIHSEDLLCLKKIRQLAEQELKLKNCIGELESKEIMYRRQMGKLLSCKKFQRDSGKMTERAQESKENDRKLFSSLQDYTRNKYITKKKPNLEDKKRKTCCSCAVLSSYEELSKGPFKACCVSMDHRMLRSATDKSRNCEICCQQISSTVFKSNHPCLEEPPCDSLSSIDSKTGVPRLLKQSSQPCDPSETCNKCMTSAACKQINTCRYVCEEKYGCKSSLCDCSVEPLDEIYQSMPSELLHSEIDNSNSDDEEFCECCSCEASDS